MTRKQFTFTHALVACGMLTAGAVAFDLSIRGFHRLPHRPQWPTPTADAELGRQAIVRHGCGACHTIPGVGQGTGRVGPKLDDFAYQTFIAGMLPNNADNLIEWIRHPERINPDTAMPDLGVNEDDARNIAAYLYEAR